MTKARVTKTDSAVRARANDSFQNLAAGILSSKDKSTYNTFVLNPPTQDQIEAAYRSNWFARKMVDIPALDMTRAGRNWQAKKEQITLLEAEERRTGALHKTTDLIKKARLYGGALTIMGMSDKAHDQPLDLNRVKKGDLLWLHVLNRYEVQPGALETDVTNPMFGLPSFYEVQGQNGLTKIHASRVCRYLGNPVPNERLSTEQSWGDSVLYSAWDAIMNIASSSASISALIFESKIDIIKIKGLMEDLGGADYRNKLISRFELANLMKSSINSLLLDGDDEWNRLQASFSGLADIMKLFALFGSGAADIPATRMLGQSAVGLNATGDNDVRNYYDRLSSEQAATLTPAITPLDEVLIRSALGDRPTDVFYFWAPLWQMSAAEQAELAYKKAQTFQIDAGLMPPEAIIEGRANQLIEDGVYPGFEEAYKKAKLEEAFGIENDDPANENDPTAKKPGEEEDDDEDEADQGKKQFGDRRRIMDRMTRDARPRTLYVQRQVENVEDFRKHYAAQGIDIQKGLHVTIAYSRQPIDWMKTGESWGGDEKGRLRVKPGGVRIHERLGKDGAKDAVVLLFTSSELSWRHEDILRCGASWDHEGYQPHVTIAWDDQQAIKEDEIEPYQGEIVFGPELFAEIDEDWKENKSPSEMGGAK